MPEQNEHQRISVDLNGEHGRRRRRGKKKRR
jgi:hypothetical protein